MKSNKDINTNKYICIQCGRQNIRYRFKARQFVCNLCGTTWNGQIGAKALESNPRPIPVDPGEPSPEPKAG